MNLTDLANIRLISQQIAATTANTAQEVVSWMGALQAQDYAMVKWAVGVRLANSTAPAVEAALDNGDILRTHVLRPTWHLVSATDIYWLLQLTAPQIKASLKTRHKELELSEAALLASYAVLEKALRDGNHLTREELMAELEQAKIVTDASRIYHLLMLAELDGVVCSGATKAGKQTYALLAERAPKPKPLTRDEALAGLAQKYFTSHGPATIQDFCWWSGLSVGQAKRGLDMVKANLIAETIDLQTYWLADFGAVAPTGPAVAYLLPAFDEFIISYRDRRAALPLENHSRAVFSNGIFRPVVVINGQVAGTWKRTVKKDKVLVETELFQPPDSVSTDLIEAAAAQFGRFLATKSETSHKF